MSGGVGGAALAGGVVLGVLYFGAQSERDRLLGEPESTRDGIATRSAADRTANLQIASGASLAVGLLGIAAAVYLLIEETADP